MPLGTAGRAEGWAQGRKQWVDCKYAQICMTFLPPSNGSYWGNCFISPPSALPKAEKEITALLLKSPLVTVKNYCNLGLVMAEHCQQGQDWPGTEINGNLSSSNRLRPQVLGISTEYKMSVLELFFFLFWWGKISFMPVK